MDGIRSKDHAKRKLETSLDENVDYIQVIPNDKYFHDRTKKFMIKLKSFKDFCMVAQTQKAKQIRSYFITIEEVVLEHLQDRYFCKYIKTLIKRKTMMDL